MAAVGLTLVMVGTKSPFDLVMGHMTSKFDVRCQILCWAFRFSSFSCRILEIRGGRRREMKAALNARKASSNPSNGNSIPSRRSQVLIIFLVDINTLTSDIIKIGMGCHVLAQTLKM